MVYCPRCGRRVDELHSIPPDIVTRDLVDALQEVDGTSTDWVMCAECILDSS